jgi:outer membrane receptor protein involved in Fe transport
MPFDFKSRPIAMVLLYAGVGAFAAEPTPPEDGRSTATDQTEALEPVVVSATRTETPVSELSRSVSVVRREEVGSGTVRGYTLFDFSSSLKARPGTLVLDAENLLNEDYFPVTNQAGVLSFGFAKGPGRTVSVAYSIKW